MAKKMKKEVVLILAVMAIALFFLLRTEPDTTIETIEGQWDISDEVKAAGYEIYLIEEQDFDYTHPRVWEKAEEIKAQSMDAEDAIKKTIRFVVNNIKYSSAVTVQYCYDETASSVMAQGTGDCVSMSRLDTAILRAMGIPTRTMGGCLSLTKRCAPLFAAVPLQEAQVTELLPGDFKKRGFLHEWVEVWTPEKGWRVIEATSGQLFPLGCTQYLEFGYDSNRFNRCVISDNKFWSECKTY